LPVVPEHSRKSAYSGESLPPDLIRGWTPVRRQEYAPTNESRAHSDSAGTECALAARDGGKALELGERVLDRPVHHAVDDQAVPGRVDVGDAAVVALVMQAGRRDRAVARLQRRESRRP